MVFLTKPINPVSSLQKHHTNPVEFHSIKYLISISQNRPGHQKARGGYGGMKLTDLWHHGWDSGQDKRD